MTTPEPRLPGVSTREAAMILGTSQSDVLRRIKAGKLKAERFDRAGGTILRVLIDAPDATPATEPHSETEAASRARQDASEALRIAEDRLAFADTLIVANGESIARQDETIARLYAENAALIERAARAESESSWMDNRALTLEEDLKRERAAGEARAADLAARLAATEAERQRLADDLARRRWWWPW